MTGLTCRLVVEEDGHGPLAYALVTGVLSVLVFRPELAVTVVYRLGDLLSLFVSGVQTLF